jgi:quercetin dioxygenase-like cupin family protein
MRITQRPIAFEDHRGSITDLLAGTPVQHVALFTCVKGAARGNHYHKTATSFIYVLSGVLRLRYRTTGSPRRVVETSIVPAGRLIEISPLEVHELTAEEDAAFVMMTAGPDGGRQYLTDTVRETV